MQAAEGIERLAQPCLPARAVGSAMFEHSVKAQLHRVLNDYLITREEPPAARMIRSWVDADTLVLGRRDLCDMSRKS